MDLYLKTLELSLANKCCGRVLSRPMYALGCSLDLSRHQPSRHTKCEVKERQRETIRLECEGSENSHQFVSVVEIVADTNQGWCHIT